MDDNIYLLLLLLKHQERDILNGSKKLSLTPSLLQKINFACHALEFYESENSQDAEKIKDLQTIFSTTPKLAITQRVKCEKWKVDLSRFEGLKYLELSRIPMHLIEGLQSLRSQLEVFVCVRCTQCLEEIIGASDQIWDKLRTAKLSYNNIDFISSFVNMPLLQYLDLSYNKLSDAYDLQALVNLKYLNLSFNYLISVPVLCDETCQKLEVLILNNNYIQDLAAIGLMENLTHLDVSGNLLADHSAVTPLLFLPVLQRLNLVLNPLSYHPYHRFYTCSYLNKSINRREFYLDNKVLSPLEQTIVGTKGFCTSSININQTNAGASQIPRLVRSVSSRKVGKLREAVIVEGEDQISEVSKLTKNFEEPSPLKEHLETKKQLEILRERIGKDHWLHSQSGSFVQDLLGLQKSEGSSKQLTTSTPYESDYLSSSPNFYSAISESDQTLTSLQNIEASTVSSEFVTAHTTQTLANISDTEQSGASSSREEEFVLQMETQTANDDIVAEKELLSDEIKLEDSETEEVSDLWLVQKVHQNNQKEELFITLNDTVLREKNTTTGRTIEKWYLETIESCVKLTNAPFTVQLMFSTVRKDRQERTYIMEYSDAQVLLQKIGAMLESRSLTAMNQMAFRCMKCSSVFSQELNNRYKAGLQAKTLTICPTCGSNLVIEVDEVPLPSANKIREPSAVDTTPLQSSIGSADSLQNVDSSGTKSEVPTPRRYDSDIEVISNPSQSSIEVLEVQARMQGLSTPHRKRSSEERQTVAVPQLVTVPEIHPNMAGLTESSSSGSLTDSVCTAYESQPLGQSKKASTGLTDTVLEESSQALNSTYASLLEGLLKSVSSKFSPSKSSPKGGLIQSPMLFSYKDFSQVDHRIKLHLFEKVYQYDNEDLIFLLKGFIICSSGNNYEGCVVLSTHCVYILEILSALETSSDVSNWLQIKTHFPINDLISVSSILWCQGVKIELKKSAFLVLLQDTQRTLDFLAFFDNLQQEIKINKIIELSVSEKAALSTVISPCEHENEEDLKLLCFSVISSVKVVKGEDLMKYRFAPVFVTNTNVVLLQPSYSWVVKDNSEKPECICIQKISNIVDVLKTDNSNILIIQYLDDSCNKEELWVLDFVSAAMFEAFVESIRSPWETLFSVPLQISKTKQTETIVSSMVL